MREFFKTDRCDRCGAQARNVATKDGFAELLFCDHHVREHHDTLVDMGWTIESMVMIAEPKHPALTE